MFNSSYQKNKPAPYNICPLTNFTFKVKIKEEAVILLKIYSQMSKVKTFQRN